MTHQRVFILAFGLLLPGCNPMYVAGPAPLAIYHQKKDIALSLHGGTHGAGATAGVALTDFLAVRVSGGYRPWSEGENGFAMGGVTGYLSLQRDGYRSGPERNLRGFRGALSLDAGLGSGVGNSRTFNLFGSSSTTIHRFSGSYFRGQIQADVGYEWPLVMLIGTVRATLFSMTPIVAAYVEPSLCVRVGPEYLRFEVQVGLSLPVAGRTDNLGGVQPFIFSAGIAGLIEGDPKPATPELVPSTPPPPSLDQQVPNEPPGPPPPPPEELPMPPPPPPL